MHPAPSSAHLASTWLTLSSALPPVSPHPSPRLPVSPLSRPRSRLPPCIRHTSSGCQFKTTFSAKYYGAGTTTIDTTQPLSVKHCMKMVKTVMARGTTTSVSSTLAITDCGIDFEGEPRPHRQR